MTPSDHPIRLMLVNDHAVVRIALTAILSTAEQFHVVAEAACADLALVRFREHQPDITLMDIRIPGGGIEAVRKIREEYPDARIIMLSTYDLDVDVFRAFEAGASGYLLKSVERDELLAAVRRVQSGSHCVPQALKRRLSQYERIGARFPHLPETLTRCITKALEESDTENV